MEKEERSSVMFLAGFLILMMFACLVNIFHWCDQNFNTYTQIGYVTGKRPAPSTKYQIIVKDEHDDVVIYETTDVGVYNEIEVGGVYFFELGGMSSDFMEWSPKIISQKRLHVED